MCGRSVRLVYVRLGVHFRFGQDGLRFSLSLSLSVCYGCAYVSVLPTSVAVRWAVGTAVVSY